MPSVLSHPAVPIAIGLAFGPKIIPTRLLLLGIVVSVLPDLDVLAFRFGIPYASNFGHRGASHSVVFALFLALCAFAYASSFRASRGSAFWFVFVSAVSHGLLDMLTDGGLGVALAWPLSSERFFFPLSVIKASPLSLRRFFSASGQAVVISELLWVWLPCAIGCIAIFSARRKNAP